MYPRTENDPSTDIQIIGVKVEMTGIANIGGLKKFINTLCLEIKVYMEEEVR